MSNLKYRIGAIVALCLVSLWALFPRNVKVQQRGADGILRDTIQRHVPLRKGLDLQGGTYLALEVDESKQAISKDKVLMLSIAPSRPSGIGSRESASLRPWCRSRGVIGLSFRFPAFRIPSGP